MMSIRPSELRSNSGSGVVKNLLISAVRSAASTSPSLSVSPGRQGSGGPCSTVTGMEVETVSFR